MTVVATVKEVAIVHGEPEKRTDRVAPPPGARIDWPRYAWGAATIAACTAIAGLLFRHFAQANIVMIYLTGIVVVASRWGRGPSIMAAILSVAAYDFVFVPPYLTFAVSDTQSLFTFAVMLMVGLVVSRLTVRNKEQAEVARQRERRTGALYSLSRELASTRSLDAMIASVERHVQELFEGRAAVLLTNEDGRLALRGDAPPFAQDPKEMAVAQWAHEHSEPAGRGTAMLAGAGALHLPLVGSRGPVGVLAVALDPGRRPLGTDQMHLLETFANQTALALERALVARDAHRQRLAAEGEKLRNAILAAVSHDLRTPLAAISGAASSLASSEDRLDAAARRELVLTIHEEAQRMNRLANNLLEMGRLQSKSVALRREWQPLEEVFGSALHQLESAMKDREVVLRVPENLPLVAIDEVLIERVLVNLLENALRYTPPGTSIELAAAARPGEILVEVLDRGPGLVPGEEDRIFDKFFRGEAARSRQGVGLGLAVARAIVEAHAGRIRAGNREGGGAAFGFTLPIGGEPPAIPADAPQPEPAPEPAPVAAPVAGPGTGGAS